MIKLTFEVTIDLMSLLLILIIPPLLIFLCKIAFDITRRFETFFVGKYVENVVKDNNKLIQENKKLREELGYKKL